MPLRIVDDLLLLFLDDEDGTLHDVDVPDLALAAAVIAELGLLGRIRTEESGGTFTDGVFVHVVDGDATGDPLLDETLSTLAAKPLEMADALDAIANGLQDAVLARLADAGHIRREEGKFLWVFRTTSWPAADGRHEEGVRASIVSALDGTTEPDERTSVLVALVEAAGGVDEVLAEPAGRESGAWDDAAATIAELEWAPEAVLDAAVALSSAASASRARRNL